MTAIVAVPEVLQSIGGHHFAQRVESKVPGSRWTEQDGAQTSSVSKNLTAQSVEMEMVMAHAGRSSKLALVVVVLELVVRNVVGHEGLQS